MPLILPGNVGSATAATGFDVANSLRINQGDSAYLHKTFGTSSDRKKWTYSFWIKKASQTDMGVIAQGADGNNKGLAYFNAAGDFVYFEAASGSVVFLIQTNDLYRDNSAWYHFVIRVDTTQGTAANRVRLYVNGTQITTFQNASYPDEDYQGEINKSDTRHDISGFNAFGENGYYFDGYMAEVVFTDGQSLAPTDFGEFDDDSGIWKPIKVSGLTFGTNGFYLDFKASGNLGNDANGGTDLTEVNLAATDQSLDTCTNNFATWNNLQLTNATMSEGNLVGVSSANSGHYSGISSIGVSSGKWYFECKQTQESAANEGMIGVIIFYNTVTSLLNPVGRGGGWGMQDGNRGFSTDSGGSGSTADNFHAGWTDDDIIGIALDIDNSKVYFSKNGSWNNSGSWNASSPTTSQTLQNALGDGTYFFMAGDASGSNNNTWSANFGSPAHAISSGNTDGDGFGNFEYAVPSGYFALCTKNLAENGG